MKSFFKEFKEFAIRGNAINLAVGVIIGNAFTAIVNSLVNDIIMPLFASVTGNIKFSDLSIVLNGDVTWNYGNFIQNIVNFMIIAFSIFCAVKIGNSIMHNHKKEEEKKEPVVSDETKALREIIELLKKEQAQ